MRHFEILAAPLTALALAASPVAVAEPSADAIFSKWMSTYSVSYQGRYTLDEMIGQGQRVCALLNESHNPQTVLNARQHLIDSLGFTKKDATGIVASAINSYCHEYYDLATQSGMFADQ